MNNKITPRLTAKVAARNQVNGAVQKLAPELLAAVAPFVGTKVILNSGGFVHKLGKALAPFQEGRPACRVWFSSGHGYSLVAGVSVNVAVDGQHGVCYAEETIYLGSLKNGVLESLCAAPAPCPIHTVASVLAARAEVEAARNALRLAETNLAGFGEHDNF